MKPLELKTVDARAKHVLAAHGKAPNVLQTMDESERAAMAALCTETGILVNGAASKFRELMRVHLERFKATDEECDEPAPLGLGESATRPRETAADRRARKQIIAKFAVRRPASVPDQTTTTNPEQPASPAHPPAGE